MLNNELLHAGISPPALDEDEEVLANKVLETVGLPTLPTSTAAAQSFSLDQSSRHLSADAGLDEAQLVFHGANGQSTAQAQIPSAAAGSVDPALDASLDMSLGFNDLYSFTWDDQVSPDWPWMSLFPSDNEMVPNAEPLTGFTQAFPRLQAKANPAANVTFAGTTEGFHDDEVDQELVGQIAARFGSLHVAPDGKLRYFGTPTNVHRT